MTGKHNRAAIYLRVSRDDQTTGNQRLVLARVAERRGWVIVQTYEDDIGQTARADGPPGHSPPGGVRGSLAATI